MNCLQAKKISITGFLCSIGNKPVKVTRNGSTVHHSPFSEDKDASLYVDFKMEYGIEVFKDFSTGAKGNILDLVMLLYKVDITKALLILQKTEISNRLSFLSQQKHITEKSKTQIKIVNIQPLQNSILINYLQSRRITISKASWYIQECYYYSYPDQKKPYFSLCWKNIQDGYELHNANRKKYISGNGAPSIFKGNNDAVNIFESMTDFLSALEHFKTTKPTGTCIVLNGVGNIGTIINTLEQYEQINLFLDNDTAGNQAFQTISQNHKNVKNYSKIIYKDHKDFNEFLTAGNPA